MSGLFEQSFRTLLICIKSKPMTVLPTYMLPKWHFTATYSYSPVSLITLTRTHFEYSCACTAFEVWGVLSFSTSRTVNSTPSFFTSKTLISTSYWKYFSDVSSVQRKVYGSNRWMIYHILLFIYLFTLVTL